LAYLFPGYLCDLALISAELDGEEKTFYSLRALYELNNNFANRMGRDLGRIELKFR
jgi:hypothetical protein